MLLYHVGTRLKSQCQQHTPLIVRHVMNGNIRTEPQLAAAVEYLLSNTMKGIDEEKFLDASGVGVVVTAEQIQNQVQLMNILLSHYLLSSGPSSWNVKITLVSFPTCTPACFNVVKFFFFR